VFHSSTYPKDFHIYGMPVEGSFITCAMESHCEWTCTEDSMRVATMR